MNANILDTVDSYVLGRNLQEARKKRGLTQEDAANILQVARTTITAIEKGERRIKAGELIRLSQAYGQQVSDFVRPRPALGSFRVQFRGLAAWAEQDSQQVEQAISEFEELCRNYLELESITSAPLAKKYPAEYPISGLSPEQAGEGIAVQERNRLGLGDGPLPFLRDILEEDVGLRVFYLSSLPARVSEIYAYTDELGGCIAINRLHSEERRRWSLASGYAHFLAHRYAAMIASPATYERRPANERFAASFARNFLMPTEGLKRRFYDRYLSNGKVTPADLCTLAHYYGVSVEALTQWLEDLRLLPAGTWEKMRAGDIKMRAAQRELGFNPIFAHDDRLPGRYQHLAFQAFSEGLITEGQFARFLGLSRLQSRRFAELFSQEAHFLLSDVNLGIVMA